MKKLLLLLCIVFLIVASIPLSLWWISLQPQANVSLKHTDIRPEDIRHIRQFIQQNQATPTHKRVQFPEQDLNQLLAYSSQQLKPEFDFAGHIDLHPQNSQLLISVNTGLPLRPYLNLQINFDAHDKTINLLGGRLGSIELPQQSAELLVNMTMPYAQQHPQFHSGKQLWQTIETINIEEDILTIDFIIDEQVQAQLQQQQLEIMLGKDALNRLPFYQQKIETLFYDRLGQRIKLQEVMKALFAIAELEHQNGANAVTDNKAIMLALFLHTLNPADAKVLQLNQHITLPQQAIEFTIERRKDLAQHFLGTAAITLYANSTIADAIGLYKELQDQNGSSGFSASDLIADRAGSLLATQLTQAASAAYLQQHIASTQTEAAFFPNTKRIDTQIEQQLANLTGDQTMLLNQIAQQIDDYVQAVEIYQLP